MKSYYKKRKFFFNYAEQPSLIRPYKARSATVKTLRSIEGEEQQVARLQKVGESIVVLRSIL